MRRVVFVGLCLLLTALAMPVIASAAPYRFDVGQGTSLPDLTTTDIPIVVSGADGTISGISLSMYLNHTFVADLSVYLIAPDGTTCELTSHNGSSGDDYGTGPLDEQMTTFTDSAATSITAAIAPFAGPYKPEQSLDTTFTAIKNAALNGTWKLRITDSVGGDSGTFRACSLRINTIDRPAPVSTLTAVPAAPEASGWYKAAPVLSLTSSDDGGFYYKWNTASSFTANAGGPIAVSEGTNTLYWYAQNSFGTRETERARTFKVDLTAPTTTSDAVASYVGSATVKLTPADTGSGVAATYYQLDGGAAVTGTSVTTSTVGSHTLSFWSVDNVGHAAAATTANFAVTATPKTPVALTKPKAPRTAKVKKSFSVSGSLTPVRVPGSKAVRIYKDKKFGSKWKPYGSVTAKMTDETGYTRYSASIKLKSKGTWRLRAYAPANALHLKKWSKAAYVKVK